MCSRAQYDFDRKGKLWRMIQWEGMYIEDAKNFAEINHGVQAMHWDQGYCIDVQNNRGTLWFGLGTGNPSVTPEHVLALYDINKLERSSIIPRQTMEIGSEQQFWVVSPNVHRRGADRWKTLINRARVAVVGWFPPEANRTSPTRRFCYEINKGDIILVGRRHEGRSELVGVGVVSSAPKRFKRRIRGISVPSEGGAYRLLSRYKDLSNLASANIPAYVGRALNQAKGTYVLRPHGRVQRQTRDWLKAKVFRLPPNAGGKRAARGRTV